MRKKTDSEVTLFTTLSLQLVGIIAVAIPYVNQPALIWQIIGYAFGGSLFFISIGHYIIWLVRELILEYKVFRHAAVDTERMAILNTVARMPEGTQLELLRHPEGINVALELVLQQDFKVAIIPHYITDDGTLVDWWFYCEFIRLGSLTHAHPINRYTDSLARRSANLITDDLVDLGIAEPAQGNQAARWRLPYKRMLDTIQVVRR